MSAPGFFDRQARARRNTGWLVLLFTTAVLLITLAVCAVGYLFTRSETTPWSFPQWLLSQHGLVTAAVVISLIACGSLVRWLDLAGGGERVARMVNARLLDPSSQDRDEQRLRNVVEEMAIASGVPMPQLYVMDQEVGINAFVAGYSPTEAVLVVTHGALTHLTRDELQGVVGHEFSHILNGDMRLNVRLIALLAGILMIGQIGTFLLRGLHVRGSSRRGREQGLAVIAGLALTVIGYLGVFFGRLIQAAVSRQRESLADASAVQFTRNPEGIAGALYKLGLKGGYFESTSHGSDMNHMCIGESARMRFTSLLASHPPIEKRIEAIQPGMMARLRARWRDTQPRPNTGFGEPSRDQGIGGAAEAFRSHFTTGGRAVSEAAAKVSTSPLATTGQNTLSRHTGTVTRSGEAYAQRILKQLPATFHNLLYTRAGAVQLCYALILQTLGARARDEALARLPRSLLLAPQADLMEKLLPTLEASEDALGFVALELALPSLRKLDPDEVKTLLKALESLILADGRVTLFEFALISFLRRHLSPGAGRSVPVHYRSYREVMGSLSGLFSLLARAATSSLGEAGDVYREAMAGFAARPDETPVMPEKVSLRDLSRALRRLNRLSPLLKPAIIDACGYCILKDQQVSGREYDILRLVVDQLDCPMPPLPVAGR